MALNFTGFKQKLFLLMVKNESADTAYRISYAGGSSGWSYGWVQFDLASGPDIGRETLFDILTNTYPQDQAQTLYAAALSPGGTGLSTEQRGQINAALSSEYGRQQVDSATSTHLDSLIAQAESWILKASTDDKPFLQGDLGKLWLCDCYNQGFIPVTKYPEQFEAFLQGQPYRGYIKQGALSFDDILEVYFRQRRAANWAYPWDPFRRLANVVNIAVAGGYSPNSLEEAKGVLRAYTYYYVPYENILKQRNVYMDSVNAFRNVVCKPAEDMILDNWQGEWGPKPTSYDNILMGDGNDNKSTTGDYQLNGRDGNDVIFGEGGDDEIKGGVGNDTLIGGEGIDHLYGDDNNDVLSGGKGNDILDGGADTDTMIGGADDDTYIVDNTGDVVTEAANEGTDTVKSSATFTLRDNVENLTLMGTENIDGIGNDLPNVITGNTGNNKLDGGGGNDTLEGGGGNNVMDGGADDDILDGSMDDVDILWGDAGKDTLYGGTGDNNNLSGGANDDILYGANGDDFLYGEADNDLIYGGGGNDIIEGGAGNDTIYGEANDDKIDGGSGNDVLYSGGGNKDTLLIALAKTMYNGKRRNLTPKDFETLRRAA